MRPLSSLWDAEDRLRVIAAMLPALHADICAGGYSSPGRPNITSLQLIISEPAETLELYRDAFEAVVRAHEAGGS